MYKLNMQALEGLKGEARKAAIRKQVVAMRNPSRAYRATAVFGAAKAMQEGGASARQYHDTMRGLQRPHRTRRPVGSGFNSKQVTARDKGHVINRALRDSGKVF